MNILLKSATVIDPASPFHQKKADILIKNGKIAAIGKDISDKNIKTIHEQNLHVSPGWIDLYANFNDPGLEHKEDLESGARAAAKGGFTSVLALPSTQPPLHSKSEIEYVKNKTAKSIVSFYPVGALTYERKGKDLTEIYDMHKAGAVAFSDADKPVRHAGVMQRGLLYIKPFNGVIFSRPEEPSISGNGSINESALSTRMGIKGMPALAEEMMITRDLYLTEYTGSRIHFACISTARAVELIREAKKKNLQVTASVSAYHFLLNEDAVAGYDSNYKVNPPLRTKKDVEALKKGLKDGTIDAIVSQHTPQDEESKKVEFEYAAFGMINLETAFAAANTALGKNFDIEILIDKLAVQPRKILNLPVPSIKEGGKAELTLFLPDKKWIFAEEDICSKSKNTPFIGKEFTGKVVGIINNNQIFVS